MKTIVKNFEKVINEINGKLVWIGLRNEYLLKRISSNKKITYCDLLNGISLSKEKNKKGKYKNLSIKDFRKYFKKKNINYLVANINDIEKCLPRFIINSIYICNGTIYIYGNDSYDYERLVRRYKRYSKNVNAQIFSNEFVIKVDVSSSKNNFFKDKIYLLFDNIIVIIDMISDLIIS